MLDAAWEDVSRWIATRRSIAADELGDPLALLTERARQAGLSRRGDVSCGGSSRLLPTADGYVAVSLNRPDDGDLVDAWLEHRCGEISGVAELPTDLVARRSTTELVERGALLGLPVSAVGEQSAARRPPVRWSPERLTARRRPSNPFVVDLSALWAGPLCGHLLALGGADVVKVESRTRPDGLRRDPHGFFDVLNGNKQAIVIDVEAGAGRDELAALVRRADVVIESSRPRALRHLGIDAEQIASSVPTVWISITAHGRGTDGRNRVGFGDDAAAAGGLVVRTDRGPCFVADAIADPLTGLMAAAAAVRALDANRAGLADVSMSAVAAAAAHTAPTEAATA